MIVLLIHPSQAQVSNAPISLKKAKSGSKKLTDSLKANATPDSTRGKKGMNAKKGKSKTDSDPPVPNIAVNFSSQDSLTFDLRGSKVAKLFGASKVEHTSGSMQSGTISLDLDNNQMEAIALNEEDTLAYPILSREKEELRSTRVLFNYETERAKFDMARMKYEDGNLIGTEVKNKTEHVVFVRDGIYSTCELDHPHYYIKAEKMKVVNEEEIFFTNARLFILDIPYPIPFPVGYVPADIDKKKSGLLAPTYVFQNAGDRGLGINNLGWFQYFNDYLTGLASFDVFTSGTYNASGRVNYSVRDKYSGSVNIGYSVTRPLVGSDPNSSISTNSNIQISHNQTLSPYAKINANVNLRSADYNRNTSFDIEERAEISTNSKMGYTYRHPENLYNFSIQANHTQNFADNTVSLRGPSAQLGFKQFTPFQKESGGQASQPNPLEALTINYNAQATMNFQYRPALPDSEVTTNWFDALMSPSLYREVTQDKIPYQYGIRQNMNITTRLLPSEVINLTTSAQLNEYWLPYSIEQFWDTTGTGSQDFKVRNGFETARDFTLSLSLNTKLYGISNIAIGSFKAFRHTIIPTISFSYQPNFQSDFWGYYDSYERPNTDGSTTTVNYSRFSQSVYSPSSSQGSQSINLSIANVFETKQVHRDSLGEKKERIIKLIDNLSLSTSYNFKATRNNLADLRANMSSSIINNLNLRANANFSFYDADSNGNATNTYLWDSKKRPLRLTSFSFSTGTRYSGGKKGFAPDPYYYPAQYDPLMQQEFLAVNPYFYNRSPADFSVPWSVSINFQYNWRKVNNQIQRSAVLNANSIQFNPTPKWNVSTTLGYDFIQKELTPNQIRITRQIHCWDMSFLWNPFSKTGNSYYLFNISIRNAQFQSLIQKLPLLNNLQRGNNRQPNRPLGF